MNDPARFLDALARTYSSEARNKPIQVLIIGPGSDEAFDDLLELFPLASFTAIEIDQPTASKLSAQFSEGTSRIVVLEDDASRLAEVSPGPYDLVIIRHPDVARFSERWTQVLEVAVTHLREGGRLVITSYSLSEISFVDQVMRNQPVTQRPGSPYTSVPVALQGNDRYILIYRRV